MAFDKNEYLVQDDITHRYKRISEHTIGDSLTGTVQENKQVFDDYPDLISEKHNQLINNLESVVASSVTEAVLKTALLNTFYPVGSYYETSKTVAQFDPNTAWGGTWVLETSGQVHVSAGDGYNIGTTGGEATHTLTASESGVPAHNHGFTNPTYKASGTAVSVGKHSASACSRATNVGVSVSAHSATACTRATNVALSGGSHQHAGSASGRRILETTGETPTNTWIKTDYYQNSKYSSATSKPFLALGALSGGSAEPAQQFQSSLATGYATPSFTITQPAFNTPSLSHTVSVTQPAFNTPELSHTVSVTQPTISKDTNGSVSNNTATNASSAHNNMQPYIVVNRWHRTA